MTPFRTISYQDIPLFGSVAASEWNDWKWQMTHAVRDIETLSKIIDIDDSQQQELEAVLKRFRMDQNTICQTRAVTSPSSLAAGLSTVRIRSPDSPSASISDEGLSSLPSRCRSGR